MGQYYKAVNLDKQETISPYDFHNGAKLTESCYVRNEYVRVLSTLLSTDWKGDKVVLCGDYADGMNEHYALDNAGNKWFIAQGLGYDPYCAEDFVSRSEDFEDCRRDCFAVDENGQYSQVARKGTFERKSISYRYIINETKGIAVDRTVEPVAWISVEGDKILATRYDALTLFLACGNGQGGGDYYGAEAERIGEWCGDVVYCADELPEGVKIIESPFYEGKVALRGNDNDVAFRVRRSALMDNNVLEGKVVAITGKVSCLRADFEDKLRNVGAIIANSVTKKTDLLICNDAYNSTTAKIEKARKLGITIMSEQQLKGLLEKAQNPAPKQMWFEGWELASIA